MFTIMDEVMQNEKYMKELQEYFHIHPEKSSYEDKTIQKIIVELEKIGVKYVNIEKGGVLVFIDGMEKGKTVLLRADIDALEVDENPMNLVKKKKVVSENMHCCHACGHDGHTAMLLTAIKILNNHKDLIHGRIICMFERAEEKGGGYAYLYKYIRDNEIKINSAYGIHLYSGLETGKIAINTENVMSGSISIICQLKGKGGHGSRPDLANSPLDCFVAIYNGMNILRMKKVSPYSPCTSSLGIIKMGTARNIIPPTLEFSGTTRVFDMDEGLKYKQALYELILNTAKTYDCAVPELKLLGPMFPVKNDPACVSLARKCIGAAIGEKRVVTVNPWMASDCVGYHLALWPGVYSLVGINNPEKGTGANHHSPEFELDQDALKYGAASSVAYALAFLDSDIDTSKSPYLWKKTMLEMFEITTRDPKMTEVLK